jgi:hypothetical protein
MPVDINTFFTVASQKQFSRDFFMRVKQIRAVGIDLDGEDELVFARTASLPGRDIEDKLVNFSGQTFHLNGKSNYPGSDGYAIEFYMDQELDLRKKLEQMSRASFDNETTSGQMCMPGPESYMILDILKAPCGQGNQGGAGFEVVHTVKLVGVNIRTIGEVSYNIADGTGEVLTIPTTWSFHFYENFSN